MISTFTGLSIATRGLYSSQVALSVTSTNISNESTDGYSRQVVNQTTAGTAAVFNGRAVIGGGSEVKSVDRVRDNLLDEKYWRENGSLGEWTVKSNSLTEIEEVLGEPSENGFSSVMDEFYSALENLSNDVADSSVRTTMLETANSVCSYLNDTATRLQSLREDANASVKTTVEEINSYAQQIASLNSQIQQATVTGVQPNDLLDQRDVLIDKLSGLTRSTVNETTLSVGSNGNDNQVLSVSVNGVNLVTGGNARQLECYESTDGLYGIRWQDTGDSFDSSGGELQGYLDLRDGTGEDSEFKGIPYYLNQLNSFAQTFAEAFNEGVYKDGTAYYAGHAGGYGSDGSTGIRFFTYDGCLTSDFMSGGSDNASRYARITAANISVSQDIQDDVGKIAASSSADEAENNENVSVLISICQDNRLFDKGTPEDFMNSIISALGTDSSYAQRLYTNNNTSVKNIGDKRSSVSGVSTNEETANLTKYQQSYNAAGKLVSLWNEIYETTINMVNA